MMIVQPPERQGHASFGAPFASQRLWRLQYEPRTGWPMQGDMQSRWHFLGGVPENYERYLVPRIFALWAEDLVEAAALRAGERVLDIASGTGIVARIAARRLGNRGSIVGLDTSAPMLATARVAATAEGAAVEWREGDALDQPFTDGAFEVVLCQQGLQFFPDKPRGLREMHRVLRPGGRIVLSVWGPIERSPGFAVLAEALTRHVDPQAGNLLASGPFSLCDTDELRTLIAGGNFQDIVIRRVTKTLHYASLEEFVLGYMSGSALAGVVGDMDESARASLIAEVTAKLGIAIDEQGLRFPTETNIATAHT
jgi:ubiquinone/menaquinone biosynthesis C-methylase UbiE